eukprot:TRINITY_DN4641_c0_g1_i1.p1 TRINITY_DN4641_c0_g1~~TRINITY_DN4641_c0_g1_i1.p1  ORF type:complete len:600 (+),score=106.09 TRINITY_DN4641_c0_g1_i1:57-1802(+)
MASYAAVEGCPQVKSELHGTEETPDEMLPVAREELHGMEEIPDEMLPVAREVAGVRATGRGSSGGNVFLKVGSAVVSVALLSIAFVCLRPDTELRSHPPLLGEARALGIEALTSEEGPTADDLVSLYDLKNLARGVDLSAVNASIVHEVDNIHRRLQEMKENPLGMPIATCVIDTLLVANFIGQLGIIMHNMIDTCNSQRDVDKQIENLPSVAPGDKLKMLARALAAGCHIGIESSVALFGLIATFLAGAANACAMSTKHPPNAGAMCATDIAMFSGAVAYLAAAAETIDIICPPQPYNSTFIRIIADVVSRRRLDENNETLVLDDEVNSQGTGESGRMLRASALAGQPAHPLNTLPSEGPWGAVFRQHRELFDQKKFYSKLKDSESGKHLLKAHEELKAEMAKDREMTTASQQAVQDEDNERTAEEAKCALDITGVTLFVAAAGLFVKQATLECPQIKEDNSGPQAMQMGCAMDISAVFAALTGIGGFLGVIAVECPAEFWEVGVDGTAALCSTGILNVLASLGFMAAPLADVGRSCAAVAKENQAKAASCAAHPACASIGLKGQCCPTPDGSALACCAR